MQITQNITKGEAYRLLRKAGKRPVLPYRGYATVLNETSRIARPPEGGLVLITDCAKLEVPPIVEAHIRANPTLAPATIEALSEMIRVAYQNAPEIIARNP